MKEQRTKQILICLSASLGCFWLGNQVGLLYVSAVGTVTQRLAAAVNLSKIVLHPLQLSSAPIPVGCGVGAILLAGLAYFCIKYSGHRLVPQKEYGSARWGTAADIAPFLHEKASENIPLTATESLSLTALKLYVSGSMDLFAHQTNVNVQNHCICFNTVKLGKSMQSIGMLTVLDQVWNRITRNRVLGRRTWVFTDEFQQLLGNKDCTDFYFQLSSRARKWGAILTSITQHVRSVLDNEDARRMLSDCGYIKLLNQSPDDANDLARLLHISNEEKRYIESAEVGSGLLIVSKTVVPFNNDFPKDTELFRLMDTSPNQKS